MRKADLPILIVSLILFASLIVPPTTYGQEFNRWEAGSFGDRLGKWAFGTGVGVNANGPGATRFAEVFTADLFMTERFSVGPMIQLVPPGDYTMVAGAMTARYGLRLDELFSIKDPQLSKKLSFVPYLGLGGLYANLKNTGPNTTTINDTSYYATTGISLNWDLDERVGLSLTWMHNLHDIRTASGRDRESVSYFIGINFRPKN